MYDLVSSVNSRAIYNRKLILKAFEKGVISNQLGGYSKESEFSIEKTGKEIKEKLTVLKSKIDQQKQKHLNNISLLLEKIGIIPSESLSEYTIQNIKYLVDNIPNQYSWKQRSIGSQEIDRSISDISEVKTVNKANQEKVQLMDEYNNCVNMYIECLNDYSMIDALIRNLNDNKKVKLSPALITFLGF